MARIPSPIREWIEQFTSDKGFFSSSSDVDHDATSNRTHDGDDLTPNTANVTSELTDPGNKAHTGELADISDTPDLLWKEDPNSPFSATDIGSTTLNLDSPRQEVLVRYTLTDPSFTVDTPLVRVNGVSTTDYEFVRYNGGTQGGVAQFDDVGSGSPQGTSRGEFSLFVNDDSITMKNRVPSGDSAIGGDMNMGEISDPPIPISSITIFFSNITDVDLDAAVYYRDPV